MESVDLEGAGAALLLWYDKERRDLPWRETRDPYLILVSELMLQQTQVDKAIPFYLRFVRELPDLEALAKAEREKVLGLWSGLGYYQRARNLHAAGRMVWKKGGFSTSIEGLRSLPGVGPYTAAAVASIAFGVPEPAVDSNSERVLARLLAIPVDPRRAGGRQIIQDAGRRLLEPKRPGDSNQALMELGALICRPRRARCRECPLKRWCLGKRSGRPEDFSPSARTTRRRKESWVTVVVEGLEEEDGRVLMVRRGDEEVLLAGLWELPTVSWRGSRVRAETDLGARYGGGWKLLESLGRIQHSITYRDITVRAYRGRLTSRPGSERESHWFTSQERTGVASSSVVEKVLSRMSLRRR